MTHSFSRLSPHARLWIWAASRAISSEEAAALQAAMNTFLETWSSHERPIRGASALIEQRMLLIGGEIPDGDISGCGIDKSVRLLERVAKDHGFEWLPGLDVLFRRGSDAPLESLPRSLFREAADMGRLGPQTIVVDRTIGTVEELRAGNLERPARESWAQQYFATIRPAAKT